MSETVAIILRFRKEHAAKDEFDTEPRFLPFLKQFQALQPQEPKVWLGNTLFQV